MLTIYNVASQVYTYNRSKLLKNRMDMRESMSPKPVTENTLCYVITFVALLLLLGE